MLACKLLFIYQQKSMRLTTDWELEFQTVTLLCCSWMFDGMIILGNTELFNDRTCEYGWLTMHVGNTLVSGFSMFFQQEEHMQWQSQRGV